MILFGKRGFADLNKDLERRSSWIILVSPKSHDECPEQRRKPCENGAESWAHEPRRASGGPKLQETREGLSLEPHMGARPLGSDSWSPGQRESMFCLGPQRAVLCGWNYSESST